MVSLLIMYRSNIVYIHFSSTQENWEKDLCTKYGKPHNKEEGSKQQNGGTNKTLQIILQIHKQKAWIAALVEMLKKLRSEMLSSEIMEACQKQKWNE